VKITKSVPPDMFAADIGKWIHQPWPPGSEDFFALAKDFPWAPARRATQGIKITRTGDHSFRGIFPPNPSARTPAVSADGSVQDFGEMGRLADQLRGTPPPGIPNSVGPGSDAANGFLANLDAEGRFIRVRVGLGPDDPILTYSDFGKPVSIAAPPPGDLVVDPKFDLNMYQFY
jgi:hypothetical protein